MGFYIKQLSFTYRIYIYSSILVNPTLWGGKDANIQNHWPCGDIFGLLSGNPLINHNKLCFLKM